jgi:catechol 2,3-dioxygenase-like lactoylglutathione lyase family enzyme
MKNIVRRTTLIVRDVERSARWYEYVVGMTRYYEDDFVLTGRGIAAGKAGDRTHLVIMRCEHPDIGMIGLLQWVDPPLPAPAEIRSSVTYGNPTFVVGSDDCREALRRARELGSRIHSEPYEWSVTTPDGALKRYVSACVFDPDGYFSEFNQPLAG